MQTIRTIKELLRLLLEHWEMKKGNYAGLCRAIFYMEDPYYIIIESERNRLIDYITNNRPKKGSVFYDPNHEHSSFFWEGYNSEIRVRWLKYHIRICKS